MLTLLLSTLTLTTLQPLQPQEFRLKNGLSVILLPQRDYSVAIIALGINAGVYDEPEGRQGLAHLAEHLFWRGASPSYPANKAFDLLSRNGPLGQPHLDANAETLWNLTYFYTARPAADLNAAMAIFAEKLQGVTFDPALVATEKDKVLLEIENAEKNLKRFPALARSLPRYPKAGVAADVGRLEPKCVEDFLATHYRPDRTVLLVQGAFDGPPTRQLIELLFGKLTPLPARTVEAANHPGNPRQAVAEFDCSAASPSHRAALRILAAAWEMDVRRDTNAFMEYPHGGIRFVVMKPDVPFLERSRDTILTRSAQSILDQGRNPAGNRLRQLRWQIGQKLPMPKDQKQYVQTQLQLAIWRLQFEAEGGQDLLEELEKVTPPDLEAAKKYLRTGQFRTLP